MGLPATTTRVVVVDQAATIPTTEAVGATITGAIRITSRIVVFKCKTHFLLQ